MTLLARPKQEELDALARVASPEFMPLMEYLRRELAATLEVMVLTDSEVMLRKLQGRARFITEFTELVHKALDSKR